MEQQSNKTIVAEFYKRIVGQRDSSLINQYVHEHYIQHSPMGRDGRQGLFEMVEFLKTLPAPPAGSKSPVKRLIGDGELVVIQLDISFIGKRMVVIDLFRVADGILVEHWDAVQEIAAANDLMTDGTSSIDNNADANANKLLVSNFYRDLSGNKDQLLNSYLSPGYIEHNLAEPLDSYHHHLIKVHRIMGEGDFVVVQSEFIKDAQSFALYDILRIENGKIAEHWGVRQTIPDVMQHNNGML